MPLDVLIDGHAYSLDLKRGASPGEWLCQLREGKSAREFRVSASAAGDGVLSLLIDGRSFAFTSDGAGTLALGNRRFHAEVRDPRSLRSRLAATGGESGPVKLTAPMPGKVVRLLKTEGAAVEAGEGVLVVEAMKMQNELSSPKRGKITKLLVAEGAAVNAGDALAVVE